MSTHALANLSKCVPPIQASFVILPLLQALQEVCRTRVEIERIEAQKEILLAKIKSDSASADRLIEKVFAEREEAISIIKRTATVSSASGNTALAVAALEAICKLVSTAPTLGMKGA